MKLRIRLAAALLAAALLAGCSLPGAGTAPAASPGGIFTPSSGARACASATMTGLPDTGSASAYPVSCSARSAAALPSSVTSIDAMCRERFASVRRKSRETAA